MVTKSSSNHGETIVRSTCQQCLYLCGALLHIQNRRVVKIETDPEHPQLDGLCPRGASYLNILNSPDRLKHPLMKDEGGWKKVSWEQALDDIARKLKEIKERYTPLAISVAAAKLVYDSFEFTTKGELDRRAVENLRRLYIEYALVTEKTPAAGELLTNNYLGR